MSLLIDDKKPKKVSETTTITTSTIQPRDPRLKDRYNPTLRKEAITDYKYEVPKSPLLPVVNLDLQNDGFYTTDKLGNRVYDENTYSGGGANAKLIKSKPIRKVPVPQFKTGVKKMVVKKK